MKYAVLKTGGKQYRITEGQVLEVERLPGSEKKEITFDTVLLYAADGAVHVGNPTVADVTIKATVLGDTKGKKIRVSKYKAKVRYRRVTGHRQSLTKVKIDSIEAKGKTEKKSATPTEDKKSNKTVKKAQE